MSHATAYKFGEASAPAFASEYEIVQKAVLQVTDIKTNHNKYYALELHRATAKKLGAYGYRLFTHYGRTDDLENNPNAGQKECRYFTTLESAQAEYRSIYNEKTSPRKGYKELSLASTKIGSDKARGTSAGEIDSKTLAKIQNQEQSRPVVSPSNLNNGVQHLIQYLYAEATEALTTTVQAKITANGIETPLGVLTLGQIEKGEEILHEMYELFQKGAATSAKMTTLSSAFYTVIPHRIGRTQDAIRSAVINDLGAFAQKQETLQLMKDMLSVNGEKGSVLFDSDIDAKYKALGCAVDILMPGDPEFEQIKSYFIDNQIKTKSLRPKNIFKVSRPGEAANYRTDIGNDKLLFHGSRIKNWVGLLSRGLLLPKIVVSLGVKRTDAGWLGSGLYFGDKACTAAYYTSPGREKTAFMALASVAMGKMKDYTKITYGISAPPVGFDSVHGVRHTSKTPSEFADDEYVIYSTNQQKLQYLVEFTA